MRLMALDRPCRDVPGPGDSRGAVSRAVVVENGLVGLAPRSPLPLGWGCSSCGPYAPELFGGLERPFRDVSGALSATDGRAGLDRRGG